MNIRDGLRFDALRRINNQQRALARGEAARNFICKINVPRCIQQVQLIRFAPLARVMHGHRVRLDRDPALPFQVH
jgi:hypothetical protein